MDCGYGGSDCWLKTVGSVEIFDIDTIKVADWFTGDVIVMLIVIVVLYLHGSMVEYGILEDIT